MKEIFPNRQLGMIHHPCVSREQIASKMACFERKGSSLHMQGTVVILPATVYVEGIIPA